MDFGVGFGRVAACVAIDYCQKDVSDTRWQRSGEKLLAGPPGCSWAYSLISYTMLSTTIHRSSGILCLDISSTEITRAIVRSCRI